MKVLRVGLLRHFKVERGYPNTTISTDEFVQWVKEYDESGVIANDLDMKNIEWKKCYSSDLPRAVTTAQAAFSGNIEYLEELREIPQAPLFQTNMKLPHPLHIVSIRTAWYFNHKSQPESRNEVVKRINSSLDKILESTTDDVLIVGHGGIMYFMQKELIKRGFIGPKIRKPMNGEVYLFEK